MYSTYEKYLENGGTLSEQDYEHKGKRAAYLIDYETMGVARDAPASMADALCDCECALIDALAAGSFSGDDVQSFSNDGYSETRSSWAQARKALRGLLSQYLTFPINLLSRSFREIL